MLATIGPSGDKVSLLRLRPHNTRFFSSSTTRSFATVLLIFSTSWSSKTEQWAGGDCAKGLAASGIDPQNGSVDRSKDCALPDTFLDRSNATLRREHLCISSRLFFLQWRRGKQLLGSNSGSEVSICDPEITDSLVIRGPGDLLPLIKSALHVRSRLGLFKCRAGGCCLFTRYFLLLVTCAPQNPGSCLACAIGFGHRSLQTRLQFITGDLAK